MAAHLYTVHLGHHDVADDNVCGIIRFKFFQRFLSVAGSIYLIPLFQCFPYFILQFDVVFYNQHGVAFVLCLGQVRFKPFAFRMAFRFRKFFRSSLQG